MENFIFNVDCVLDVNTLVLPGYLSIDQEYMIRDSLTLIDKLGLTLQYNFDTDSYNLIAINGFPIVENIEKSYTIDSKNLRIQEI